MPKKQGKKPEDKHKNVRKAVFSVLAIVLAVMMGRIAFEAYSFVSAHAGIPSSENEITGMAYTISGGSCPEGDNSIDCCEKACSKWCLSKGETLYKAAVVEPIDVKCRCTCII